MSAVDELARARAYWRRASDPQIFAADKETVYPGHAYANGHHLFADKDVLEYGCGRGGDTLSMIRYGARVTYADIVQENVEATTQRIIAELPTYAAKVRSGGVVLPDSLLTPFQSDSFDFVHCHGVLHHIQDPVPVLREMHRVLRPEGELFTMLYTERYEAFFKPARGPCSRDGWLPDGEGCPWATAWTYEQGETLLERGGFELLSAIDYNHGYFRVFRGRRKDCAQLPGIRILAPLSVLHFEGWTGEDHLLAELPADEQAQRIVDRLRGGTWTERAPEECAVEMPTGLYHIDEQWRATRVDQDRQFPPTPAGTIELQCRLAADRTVGQVVRRGTHRKQPRIIWISSGITEAEYDLHADGVEVRSHEPIRAQRENGAECAHAAPLISIYRGAPATVEQSDRLAFLRRLAAVDADLFVFRYPYWLVPDGALLEEFHRLFRDRPVVAWTSEQGPMRQGTMYTLAPFHHVAANNWIDVEFYRQTLPGKIVHYLPYGCRREPPFAATEPRAKADVIADGTPHYACGGACDNARAAPGTEGIDHKRRSVEIMVVSLLRAGIDLAVWGNGTEFHGWRGIPEVVARNAYRGMYHPGAYPAIYAGAKVYSGITWNWATGGYGTKLARALSTGIAVMWHRTEGMALDGLLHGAQLLTPATAAEAVATARALLADEDLRHRIGKAGQEFAIDKWAWVPNLRRLAEEL